MKSTTIFLDATIDHCYWREGTQPKLTETVTNTLRERLERERRKDQSIELIEDVMENGRHCAALPLLDPVDQTKALERCGSGSAGPHISCDCFSTYHSRFC
jgi:hypothetical protein